MQIRKKHQWRRLEEIVRLKSEIRVLLCSAHYREKRHDFLSLASPGDDGLEPVGLLAGHKGSIRP